jgi:RarD protein
MAVAGTGERKGIAYAFGAFLLWGLFPLYWKQLAAVPALEVVAHRTVWGFACLAAWVSLLWRWPEVRALVRAPRTIGVLTGSAALIGFNWLLYVWAVTHGHIVDASLGYYLNPLVNVLLGIAVLRERLSRGQALAVALAAAGVGVLTLSHGRLPWIALALAGSFGLYGLVRKTVAAEALVGLLWETALLAGCWRPRSGARAPSAAGRCCPLCCSPWAESSPWSRCCCSRSARGRCPSRRSASCSTSPRACSSCSASSCTGRRSVRHRPSPSPASGRRWRC